MESVCSHKHVAETMLFRMDLANGGMVCAHPAESSRRTMPVGVSREPWVISSVAVTVSASSPPQEKRVSSHTVGSMHPRHVQNILYVEYTVVDSAAPVSIQGQKERHHQNLGP